MTITDGVAVGAEVRVTRVDGRTFAGRLRKWGVDSVTLDTARPSRSTVRPSRPWLIRIAIAAIDTIEPWDRAKGFAL